MPDVTEVVSEANRLATKDEAALELLLGMREKAIEENPQLREDLYFEPKYDGRLMGPLEDIRGLGRRILNRWNKQLYGLVCGKGGENEKERDAILGALNIGETAVIGAVAAALLALGVPPPIAAPLAPLIVKMFVWPAKGRALRGLGRRNKSTNS